jgi:hypothetical protein
VILRRSSYEMDRNITSRFLEPAMAMAMAMVFAAPVCLHPRSALGLSFASSSARSLQRPATRGFSLQNWRSGSIIQRAGEVNRVATGALVRCRAGLEAVVFDCDGVILESEDLHRRAYNAAFQEFQVRSPASLPEPLVWTPEFYDELQNTIGGGKPKMRW